MHLRSHGVRVQIASVLLVRVPHITTPQELCSLITQGNCQGKSFPIPKASQTKRKEARGEQIEVMTNSDPPTVARSATQLTNISMGTTSELS
jgi:hypothetical protein